MSKAGPIIIIEDDRDDKDLFEDITRELEVQNEIIWFINTADAFTFLKETSKAPFLIFSDINLPGQSGLDFKRQIDQDPELRSKSIPFVFLSTTASDVDVRYAYTQMTVQGFFKKANNYAKMKMLLNTIYSYWMECKHPNSL